MASQVQLQITGLSTSNNPFAASVNALSTAGSGALARADNTVLNSSNQLEPRRGFEALSYTLGSGSDRANVLHWYGSTLMVHYGTNKITRDTGSAFSDYSGTYAPIDASISRIKFVGAAGNVYFNANDGVRMLDTVTATPSQAGVPRPVFVSAINASANGWQSPNTAVAYRVVYGIVDANGNEKLGSPSGRYVLQNYIPIAVAGITRSAADGSHPAGKVLVTTNVNQPHYLSPGDTFTLTPGETNFATGLKTVVLVPSANTFSYNEAGSNVSSTAAEEAQRTRSASLNADVPPGITTSHFYRIYRSEMSATAGTTPSDELYLCKEGQPTGGEISAKQLSAFSDTCPENFLGDPAPWNGNEGYGLDQANERPPLALDLAWWDSRLIYANCTQRHRFFLNMLGVGTPDGVQLSDTLTVAGSTYVFQTAGPGPNPNTLIFAADTPSLNVQRTAQYLCNVINAYTSNTTVRATYISGDNDPSGKILIEEIAIGGNAFSVSASRIASWNPALSRNSDNNRKPHALMFSKPGEPEAVPSENEILVGSQNDAIIKIIPLKTSLIVFKQQEGIWEVTGTNGRYIATKIGVARLLATQSVAQFSDRVWCLTDQGVTTITEGAGVSVVSYNIENQITPLFGTALTFVKRYSFGVPYESERRYLAFMPSVAGDVSGTQAFNYSTGTKGWTRWTKAATCGAVDPNTDKIFLGSGTANKILVERKGLDGFSDFCDESFTVTISSIVGNVVTLNTSSHGVQVGDALAASISVGSAYPPIVTAVNGAALTVNVANASIVLPSSGACTAYPGIDCQIRWQPLTAGDPSFSKLHRQATFLFKGCTATQANAVFASDVDPIEVPVSLIDFPATLLGNESTARSTRISPLPMNHAQSGQLTVGFSLREAFTTFKLHGCVVNYEAESEKGGRRY